MRRPKVDFKLISITAKEGHKGTRILTIGKTVENSGSVLKYASKNLSVQKSSVLAEIFYIVPE